MGLQLEDALLLFQQFFLVLDLLLEVGELQAQGIPRRRLLRLGTAVGVDAGLCLGQLTRQARAGVRQLLQTGELVALVAEALPAITQRGFGLTGQQGAQGRLVLRVVGAGPLQVLVTVSQRRLEAGDALRHALRVLLALLLAGQRLGDGLGQVAARTELLAPGTQALAQQAVLRVGRQLCLHLPPLPGQGLASGSQGCRLLLAVAARPPQAVGHLAGGLGLLFTHLRQGRCGFGSGLLGTLPVAVGTAQALGRLAGGQLLQLRLGGVPGLPGGLALGLGGVQAGLGVGHGLAPLALALQGLLLLAEGGFAGIEGGEFVLQALALRVVEQFDALGAGAGLLQRRLGFAGGLEHPLGDQPVHLGAGEFLQQLGALVGAGFEEGGEPTLGQQHGLGEALEIEPGEAFGLFELVVDLVGEDLPVGDARQLHLGWLQPAVHLVAGPALAPEGAVAHALHLELHLGQAVGGVPRHQLVGRGGDAAHARCAVVERQADGVQQGGLAGTGGAGDGEQAVAGEGLGGEVDLPLTLERVEVLQTQAEDFHAGVVLIREAGILSSPRARADPHPHLRSGPDPLACQSLTLAEFLPDHPQATPWRHVSSWTP